MSSPSVSVVATAVMTSSFRAALPPYELPIFDRIRMVFLVMSIPRIFIMVAGMGTAIVYDAAVVPN